MSASIQKIFVKFSITKSFAPAAGSDRAAAVLSGLMVFAALALAIPAIALPQDSAGETRMGTYDTSTGETYFALSLTPDVRGGEDRVKDVVVVFDTSASQTGLYRADGLEALRTMLASMDKGTRVKLMAADLDAVALCDDFVAPDSPQVKQALERLSQRAPLGSSDMKAILRGALACFEQSNTPSQYIIYIGDGISRANILEPEEFQQLVKQLVKAQVSVSSYAIGPERDVHLLAALANHTGGMVYLDATTSRVAQTAGAAMARVVLTPVIWPMSGTPPEAIRESYPNIMPPLRMDRDSILIGTLGERTAMQIQIQAELEGEPIALQWDVEPEPSNDEFSFLPALVEQARKSGGLTLATVGSTGLREVGRMIMASADSLAEIGSQAIQTGDLEGARKMAKAVLRRDPNNPRAQAILRAIEKKEGSQSDDDSLIIKSPEAEKAKKQP